MDNTPIDLTTIAGKLKAARLMQGITMHALAQQLHCSPSYVCQVESGKAMPSPAYLHAIAKPLGCDPAALMALARAQLLAEAQARIDARYGAATTTGDTTRPAPPGQGV
jgi:transcriptional regulator with XRE-family HTH domain